MADLQALMDEHFETNRYDKTPQNWRSMPELGIDPDDDDIGKARGKTERLPALFPLKDAKEIAAANRLKAVIVPVLAKLGRSVASQVRAHKVKVNKAGPPDEDRDDKGKWTGGANGTPKGGLTADQKAALLTYQNKGGYKNVNALLNTGDHQAGMTATTNPEVVNRTKAETEGMLSHMDEVMSKSVLTKDAVLYRGVESTAEIKVGDKMSFAGFQSTSTDLANAEVFANAQMSSNPVNAASVVYKYEAPAGTHAIDINEALGLNRLSQNKQNKTVWFEHEVILDRGLSVQVTKVEPGLHGDYNRQYRLVTVKIVGAVAKLAKAADDDMQTAQEIADSLDLSGLLAIVKEADPTMLEVFGDTAIMAVGQFGFADNSGIVNQIHDTAVDYAKQRAAELVGMRYDAAGNLVASANAEMAIDDTTRAMVQQIIYQGLQDGSRLDDIADDLEGLGPYPFSEERAAIIAETEVAKAHSMGSLDGYRQAEDMGVDIQKEWLIADEEACDDCQENADAGPIDLDDTFPSGDDAPGAHPHCRCAIAPVVADGSSADEGDAQDEIDAQIEEE